MYFYTNDSWYLAALNKWVNTRPDSDAAYLLRASYYDQHGWSIRGESLAKDTPDANMDKFLHEMAQAESDISAALKLNPNNPLSYQLLIGISLNSNDPDTQKRIFEASIARFPEYYPLYSKRLSNLAPKWIGSVHEQIDFVRQYTSNISPDSPLNFLWLGLYYNLGMDMKLNCRSDSENERRQCESEIYTFLMNNKSKLKDVFGVYNHVDHYAFNEAYLLEFIDCGCVNFNYGFISSAAYEVFGNYDRSHYAFDITEGRNFEVQGFDAPALDMYNSAITAINRFPFPISSTKQFWLANIYDHIAGTLIHAGDYRHSVTYSDAAIAWDKTGAYIPYAYEHRCIAYMHLGEYKKALNDCNASLKLRSSDSVKKCGTKSLVKWACNPPYSSAFVRSFAFASRSVSGFKSYLVSMSFRIDVVS